MPKRFTEAEKQAALADLKNGMTLEQAANKHKCSTASLMQWKKALSSAQGSWQKNPYQGCHCIGNSIGAYRAHDGTGR